MLYLDTSLLISAHSRESRTDDVLRWLSKQNVAELSISDWVITEFSSALSIKLRMGVIGTGQRGAMLAQFTQLSVNTLRLLPIEVSALRTAARFCDQPHLNLRAGDALHLAICAEHGAVLCTLDQRLSQAAPLVGVGCVML